MFQRFLRPSACVLVLLGISPVRDAAADEPARFDWPQWRGPERSGVSKETGLLKEWPKDGPPLAWKMNGLGGGLSTVSVANGRIYLMSSRNGRELVIALDEKNGKELWTAELGGSRGQGGRRGPGGGGPGGGRGGMG